MGTHDDSEFGRLMAEMGVKPVAEGKTPVHDEHRPKPRKTFSAAEESDLFLEAVNHLAAVPNKDNPPGDEDKALRKLRSLKTKTLAPDDSLDLHGHTVDTALEALSDFIIRAFTHNVRTVVIITGKGKHSTRGVSRIKPAVEKWILTKGKRFIESYAEAPRAHGGRGAFIVYLRSS